MGDHHQLPPVVDSELSESELAPFGLARADLERSLFQNLFEAFPPENEVGLTVQYRMDPAIARLVSEVFYNGALSSGPRPISVVPEWPPRPVTWLSTSRWADRHEVPRGTSFLNPIEARMTRGVLERWRAAADKAHVAWTVGVIAGYDEHRQLLERDLQLDIPDRWSPLDVEVNTVDAFQGRERDLIVYNGVRSNPKGNIGFLSDSRRVNVAFSRAREKLVVIGDSDMLRLAVGHAGATPFKAVLDWIRRNGDSAELIYMTEGSNGP